MTGSTLLLFHYTSLDTLLKIVESQQLRLSDLSQSNDAEEGKFILDPLMRDIENGIQPEIVDFIKDKVQEVFHDRRALGCCFSSDGDLLSQWRGYADGGQGVCIGFDHHGMQKAIDAANLSEEIDLVKVQYGQSAAASVSADFVDEITALDITAADIKEIELRWFDFEFIADPTEAEAKTKSGKLYRAAMAFGEKAFRFKQSSFREEKEFRLLRPAGFIDDADVRYFSRNSRIVSYKNLKFKNALKAVILGPRCNASESDVERVLRRFKLKNKTVQVMRSDSSFR